MPRQKKVKEVSGTEMYFTFYWKSGLRNVFKGVDMEDAVAKSNASRGFLSNISFVIPGVDDSYVWDNEHGYWYKKATEYR